MFKKLKHLTKKVAVLTVLFSMVCWSFSTPLTTFIPVASASVTGVTVSQMVQASQTIKANSTAIPIAKVAIVNDNSAATLTSIKVTFSGTNFATTDLATLATGDTSGVSLHTGTIDTPGSLITLATSPIFGVEMLLL